MLCACTLTPSRLRNKLTPTAFLRGVKLDEDNLHAYWRCRRAACGPGTVGSVAPKLKLFMARWSEMSRIPAAPLFPARRSTRRTPKPVSPAKRRRMNEALTRFPTCKPAATTSPLFRRFRQFHAAGRDDLQQRRGPRGCSIARGHGHRDGQCDGRGSGAANGPVRCAHRNQQQTVRRPAQRTAELPVSLQTSAGLHSATRSEFHRRESSGRPGRRSEWHHQEHE